MPRFNIRVYGICRGPQGILLCREPFQGRSVTKFPGGGLEFGEGPEETIRREILEETGQEPNVLSHLYTTGFFVRSLRDPEEQLLSIYYRIALPYPGHIAHESAGPDNLKWLWVDADILQPEDLDLPVDRYVAEHFRL